MLFIICLVSLVVLFFTVVPYLLAFVLVSSWYILKGLYKLISYLVYKVI